MKHLLTVVLVLILIPNCTLENNIIQINAIEPFKVTPDSPGGLAIPYTDKEVYNLISEENKSLHAKKQW